MKRSYLITALVDITQLAMPQDAKEIVEKANELAMGNSSVGETSMTIQRPTWSRTVTMKSWSLGTDYYMILITGPARDKGQVFLKRGQEMWNWMPTISRTIKLPPSMMSQSWMGSDFTNDDLVKMNSIVEDYTHSLLGEDIVNGHTTWKIEMIPKENAAVVWGKIIMWVAKDEYFQMKSEYYDENMKLVSTMIASDIKQFNDRRLPARLEMIPAENPNQRTILETLNMNYNGKLDENFFSQQNMRRLENL
jgi:outer membrane lipoprotein-sorting protein